MKRFLFLLSMSILLLLLLVPLTPRAYAQELTAFIPDSTTIPEDISAQIDLDDDERILRVWDNIGFMYTMGNLEYDIKTVINQISDDKIAKEYYFVISSDSITHTYTNEEELGVQEDDDETAEQKAKFFAELSAELEDFAIIRCVSKDIVINNIYVLSEGCDLYSNGWIIYYDTNLGPYVYYDSIHYTQYLMPLEVFRQLAKDFIATDTPDRPSPSIYLIENYEQKYGRYDMNSPHFYLNPTVPVIVWAAIAIVFAAAVAGGVWLLRKRKGKRS